MSTAERRVLDALGRAMGRFSMLEPGDRVAVGVSGGKDSWCLLHALVRYRARAPFPYGLVAVTIEQGKFKAAIDGLAGRIRDLGVEWVVRDDPTTLGLVAGGVVHGCDVCKLRSLVGKPNMGMTPCSASRCPSSLLPVGAAATLTT